MNASLLAYCDLLLKDFDSIEPERKALLQKLSEYIGSGIRSHKTVNLVYICTHNSRRSHFGQVWAKVASIYFKIPNVYTFSGGTEATAFNLNAINALKRAGFYVESNTESENPTYKIFYGEQAEFMECFSKVYNDPNNPRENFAAIMTCSEAEENCPFIPGADLRIGTTYDDPKAFDTTELQDAKYDEKCRQIALETFYVFSLIK